MKAQSLKKKLIRLQLSMTFVILLVSWIFISIGDYFIFKSVSIEKIHSASKILSRNLGTCLEKGDRADCESILRTLSIVESIYKVVVVRPDGNVFAEYARAGKEDLALTKTMSKSRHRYVIRGKEIVSSYPIIQNGKYEGHLFLIAEFDMLKTFGAQHAVAFILTLLGSIGLAYFLFSTFHNKIIGELKLLVRTIQKIRANKTYSLRVQDDPDWKKTNIYEFRQLGESFDSMIEQVELRDFSMKKQNEDLEKIIEVKVQELLRSAELASLGEMAGGIAHEINNPLTIIKSSNRVLMKLITKEEIERETFKEFLSNVDVTVDRIAKIVAGLRNISRRSVDDDIAPCVYNEVFTDVFEVAEARFKSKGIELRKNYTQEEGNTIFMANRIQLSQVLVNLLNNSFDAIIDLPGHEKWIDIRIRVLDDRIKLFITDCGTGIDLKVREKMFNPFFTTKEIGKGTGIGLAISKSMVEKMGGEFYYDDQSSNTCFVVSLKI